MDGAASGRFLRRALSGLDQVRERVGSGVRVDQAVKVVAEREEELDLWEGWSGADRTRQEEATASGDGKKRARKEVNTGAGRADARASAAGQAERRVAFSGTPSV